MSQGLFAGCTDYTNQSLNDIQEDIEYWQKYSEETKSEHEGIIRDLKKCGYWEKNVPLAFRAHCSAVIRTCDTFAHDFGLVLTAINKDKITKREISILKNIDRVSHALEQECSSAYRTGDELWHQYGDEPFNQVEKLYADGRNYFVTLLDVGNAAHRLEDYMKEETVVDKSICAENSVVIGDGNQITKSNLEVNSPSRNVKGWLVEHLWLPIFVAVISGLLVWLVTG